MLNLNLINMAIILRDSSYITLKFQLQDLTMQIISNFLIIPSKQAIYRESDYISKVHAHAEEMVKDRWFLPSAVDMLTAQAEQLIGKSKINLSPSIVFLELSDYHRTRCVS